MMRPDLHLHTIASDGMLTPSQLARQIQKADVTIFSVTDHDTVSGLQEAAQAAYDRGLAFLPGVEISAEGEEEVHILGYGVRDTDEMLLSFLRDMDEERKQRIRTMGEKLNAMGFSLPLDEIIQSAGGSVGRPHLARAMMAAGYVSSIQEAFERFLGNGKCAFIPREKFLASKVISMLRESGAVPVLAHPGLIHWPMEKMRPMRKAWQDAGLMGLEVYHPANRGAYPMWDRLARKQGLLVTGGSDYHDSDPHHGQIGETAAEWPNAGEDAWKLFQQVKYRGE